MKTDRIHPNPNNPRKISAEALERLKASIRRDPEFMRLRPIVVDAAGTILGGNQRHAAIAALGMSEIPDDWVRRADDLTDEQRRRFVIVDNGPEGMSGEWDLELLAADWGDVGLAELGLEVPELEPLPPEENPGEELVPDKDPNVLVRLSFHPGVWLGKRDEILKVAEKMKRTYGCEIKVDE